MRVVVYGGRNFSDRLFLETTLDQLHAYFKFTVVIVGRQVGADTLGEDWAKIRGIEVDPYPAMWHLYGNRAGSLRNSKMLIRGRPELGVGFPGGPGTADMSHKLRCAQIPVLEPAPGRSLVLA